jgi:D-alanyl-D-alanine dipeptidase
MKYNTIWIILIILIEAVIAAPVQSTDINLPKGFIHLKTICPQIRQDIKYATTDNFTGKIVDGYADTKAILTTEAAIALCEAQKELEEQSLALLIWDAYRPTTSVAQFLKWGEEVEEYNVKAQYYPHLSKHELFEQGFISPNHSAHSRGSTVDLTIIDQKTNIPLEMGTEFNFFGIKSHTINQEISLQVQENRKLLLNLMEKYGFENLPQEWWHYTLKNEPFPNEYFDFIVQ